MSVYLDIKSLYPRLKVNWNVLLCKICIARRLVLDIFPWCNAHYVPFPSGTLVARRMGNGSIYAKSCLGISFLPKSGRLRALVSIGYELIPKISFWFWEWESRSSHIGSHWQSFGPKFCKIKVVWRFIYQILVKYWQKLIFMSIFCKFSPLTSSIWQKQ